MVETRLQNDVAGYVLAGGRSTRMGQDKAMLRLAGVPLVEHAVRKLRDVTEDVRILSSRAELAAFAPLVSDLRKNCGPLGGIETALQNTQRTWVLMMPVDMPLVPGALLKHWVDGVMQQRCARLSMFSVNGEVQPALCLLHRDVAPYISGALEQSRLRLYPVLEDAAVRLAARQRVPASDVLLLREWNDAEAARFSAGLDAAGRGDRVTADEWAAQRFWFSNLNTPEEFAEAEKYAAVLDRF